MRVLIAVGLLLVSSVVSADTADLKGFYAGLGVGESLIELEDEDSPADFKAEDTGYKLMLGYRFLSWLAAEVSYIDFGKASDRVLGEKLTAEFDALSANAVFLWPLGSFDLFGSLGAAAWEGKLRNRTFGGSVDDDGVDPMIGLGVQYRINRVAIRAQAESVLLGDDDEDDWTDLYSVGVTVKF